MSTMTAQTTQVYSVFIKASPEQIWEAITTPEFTRKYFFGSAIESTLEPGAPYVGWTADRSQRMVEGEVLEADPPHRLVHSWLALYDPETAAESPSRVTWELESEDGKVTKLTVVHDELEDAPKTALSVAGGWSYVLSGLKTLLETGTALSD